MIWTEPLSNVSRNRTLHTKKLGFLAVMLLLIASIAGASASEQGMVNGNGGYIVEPVYNAGMGTRPAINRPRQTAASTKARMALSPNPL